VSYVRDRLKMSGPSGWTQESVRLLFIFLDKLGVDNADFKHWIVASNGVWVRLKEPMDVKEYPRLPTVDLPMCIRRYAP